MDENVIEDILQRLTKLEEIVFASGTTLKPKKQQSAREFLKQASGKGDVETTLLLAYLLEIQREVKPITRMELEETYREAKIPPPSKLSDKIYQNCKKGFLMEVDAKVNPKTYELTASGIEHVENELLKKE